MPTYLYVCKHCGKKEQWHVLLDENQMCARRTCTGKMRRDWKGESANVATAALKAEREAR
jgi:predicted nucleic acid-binding Zn ribbon protein